jgi:purine-binding chemotaxis protein CheW
MWSDSGDRSDGGSNASGPAPALLCRVGAGRCALPLDRVIETMRLLPLETAEEAAAAPAIGWSIIRGVRTPVFSLAALLGVDPSAATRLVTVRIGERQMALSVDEVLGVRPAAAVDGWPALLAGASHEVRAAVAAFDAGLGRLLEQARQGPGAAATTAPVPGS